MADSDEEHGSKVVLSTAAHLPAWDSNAIKPESKLIEEIVGDVVTKLKCISQIEDFDDQIGIPERVNQVKLLDRGSTELQMVGIVGTGGMGKTTLAKALYDQLSFQFEASCFLGKIKESWETGRKRHLQNKIISALSMGEDSNKSNKDKRKCKKMLLILDDVEEVDQLLLLVGDRDRYGIGSRIVITSQNYDAVEIANEVYKMKELSLTESLHLFQHNAFSTKSATEDFIQLSNDMCSNFPASNPLAIKILGSTLCRKSREIWVVTIMRLQSASSDNEVQHMLRISYDLLGEQEKELFLDIACFFNGADETFTKRILDDDQHSTSEAIKNLVDMSLIKILDSKVWMHDILERLGKTIVQEQSVKEPGERSRLWNAEDVYHVLKNDTGTSAVEVMFLDMCKIQPIEMRPTTFSRMNNLRMLKLHSHFANCTLQFPKGYLVFPPCQLRYLFWDAYPFKSLHYFIGKNLVELQLQFSKAERLWNGAQELENLKVIDLSFSKQLIEIPNLSRAPNVESLSLRGCVSLREVPSYFDSLEKLISLDLENCSSLEKVSALPRNIVHVNLSRCNLLESLPSDVSMLKNLRRLELSGCAGFDFANFKKFSSEKPYS